MNRDLPSALISFTGSIHNVRRKLLPLIAIILLFAAVTTRAQTLKVYEDIIFGNRLVATKWFTFINKPGRFNVDMRVIKEHGKYYLQTKIDGQARAHYIVPNMALGFFENDKKLVALICDDGNSSTHEVDLIRYPITNEELDILAKSKCDEIRMQYDKGYMLDSYTEAYRAELDESIQLIRQQTMDNKKIVGFGEWLVLYRQKDQIKTVIRTRYLSIKGKQYLAMEMIGPELKRNTRLNIYTDTNKVSLFADSVFNQVGSSFRNYRYAWFPIDKQAAKFLNTTTFSKFSLQTEGDKIVSTEIDDREWLIKASKDIYAIWYDDGKD